MYRDRQRTVISLLDVLHLAGGAAFLGFIGLGVMGVEFSAPHTSLAQIGSGVFLVLWTLVAAWVMGGAGWLSSVVTRVTVSAWPMLMLALVSAWLGRW